MAYERTGYHRDNMTEPLRLLLKANYLRSMVKTFVFYLRQNQNHDFPFSPSKIRM